MGVWFALITAAAAGLGQVNTPRNTTVLCYLYRFSKIKKIDMYLKVQRLAQIFIVAYIGYKITRSVLNISSLWPYVIVVVVSYFLCCLLTGLAMSKLTSVDKITAFSCTQQSSSDMALIASEFGTVTPPLPHYKSSGRVIAIFPSMISLILKLALVMQQLYLTERESL